MACTFMFPITAEMDNIASKAGAKRKVLCVPTTVLKLHWNTSWSIACNHCFCLVYLNQGPEFPLLTHSLPLIHTQSCGCPTDPLCNPSAILLPAHSSSPLLNKPSLIPMLADFSPSLNASLWRKLQPYCPTLWSTNAMNPPPSSPSSLLKLFLPKFSAVIRSADTLTAFVHQNPTQSFCLFGLWHCVPPGSLLTFYRCTHLLGTCAWSQH